MWNSYELDLVNYQNKCRLIRGWDDLFNKVKEHINSVSAMKLSPYYKVGLTPPRARAHTVPRTSGAQTQACCLTLYHRQMGTTVTHTPSRLSSGV